MEKDFLFQLVMEQLRLSQRLSVFYNATNKTTTLHKILAELSDVHLVLHSQLFEIVLNHVIKNEEGMDEKICLCFHECLPNLAQQHAALVTCQADSVPLSALETLEECQSAWHKCRLLLSQLHTTRELNFKLNVHLRVAVFNRLSVRIKQLFSNSLPNKLDLNINFTPSKGFKLTTEPYVKQLLHEKNLEAGFRVLVTHLFEKHYFYMVCLKKGFFFFYLPPGTVSYFQDAVYSRHHWYWREASAWDSVLQDDAVDEEVEAKTATTCFYGQYSDFRFGPLDRRDKGFLGLTLFGCSSESFRLQAPEEGLPWHDLLGLYFEQGRKLGKPALPTSNPPPPPTF